MGQQSEWVGYVNGTAIWMEWLLIMVDSVQKKKIMTKLLDV